MSKLFSAHKLSLNLGKTNVIKFITKNSQYPLNIRHNDKYVEDAVNTKFIGLQIGNHLNWKNHNNQLVSKLNGACYAVRFMLHINNT
jgi:hypothetical protein